MSNQNQNTASNPSRLVKSITPRRKTAPKLASGTYNYVRVSKSSLAQAVASHVQSGHKVSISTTGDTLWSNARGFRNLTPVGFVLKGENGNNEYYLGYLNEAKK